LLYLDQDGWELPIAFASSGSEATGAKLIKQAIVSDRDGWSGKQSKAKQSNQSVSDPWIDSLLHAACKQHVHMSSPGGGSGTKNMQAAGSCRGHRHLRHGTQHAIGLLIFYSYSYVLDQVLNTSSCLL